MKKISRERAIEFVKYLEETGQTSQKNVYQNEALIEYVIDICSLSDKEFNKSKYATMRGANIIHGEYGDWSELHK